MRVSQAYVVGAIAIGCIAAGAFATRSIFTLTSGMPVAEMLARDSAIVAIYDPAACMSCDNLLAEWFRWEETHPRRFALVLTRAPTMNERVRMILRHVKPVGILRHVPGRSSWAEGGVYYALFVNRKFTWSEAASPSRPAQSIQATAQIWFADIPRDSVLPGTIESVAERGR